MIKKSMVDIVKDWPPLHQAAVAKDLQRVERLLQAGADPNQLTIGGMTPMECTFLAEEFMPEGMRPGVNERLDSRALQIIQTLAFHGGKLHVNDPAVIRTSFTEGIRWDIETHWNSHGGLDRRIEAARTERQASRLQQSTAYPQGSKHRARL